MDLDATRTAILVMDFQPTILATLGECSALLSRVGHAVAASREAGARVAAVRVAFTEDDLAAFPPQSAMGQRMRSLGDKIGVDAPGTQTVGEIRLEQSDIVVRKTRVGPFGTTDLDGQLRKAGINTLVVAGIHTSGCVLTCVRDAHDLDYRVIVLSDGCADPDPSIHTFLVRSIFPKQATVMEVAEYVALITPGHQP